MQKALLAVLALLSSAAHAESPCGDHAACWKKISGLAMKSTWREEQNGLLYASLAVVNGRSVTDADVDETQARTIDYFSLALARDSQGTEIPVYADVVREEWALEKPDTFRVNRWAFRVNAQGKSFGYFLHQYLVEKVDRTVLDGGEIHEEPAVAEAEWNTLESFWFEFAAK